MTKRLMNAREAYVTLELPTGEIYTGKVGVATFTVEPLMHSIYDGMGGKFKYANLPMRWSVELSGIGEPQLRQDIGVRHVGPEMDGRWKCPYCGASHPWDRDKCWDGVSGCGAWRPLGLELVE
jgi:hypothetical protein